MEILKFENAGTPRKAKKSNNLKSLAGLASVAAIAVLGSTLAANISLGSGAGIEFGQGVQTTTACDSAITITPAVRFVNAAGAGTFYLSTIALSDIDLRGTSYCSAKTFTLSAYNDSTAAPLQLATGTANAQITQATFGVSAGGAVVSSDGVSSTITGGTTQTGVVTLGFGTPSSTSGAVYKITLQSQ